MNIIKTIFQRTAQRRGVRVIALSLVAVGLLVTSPAPFACESVPALEAQREAFNQAIELRDLERIEQVLAPNAVLVTGTESEVTIGAGQQLALWASVFDAPEGRVYVRSPSCIERSGQYPLATEFGQWQGHWVEQDEQGGEHSAGAQGSYSAKWRWSEGKWRLEAELFITHQCSGSDC